MILAPLLFSLSFHPNPAEWPVVEAAEVEAQPLVVLLEDLLSVMDLHGIAWPGDDREELSQVLRRPLDPALTAAKVQELLDPLCVLGVRIPRQGNPELVNGPRSLRGARDVAFHSLVKFVNESGRQARVEARCEAPWLDLWFEDRAPWPGALHGVRIEYRLLTGIAREAAEPMAPVSIRVAGSGHDRSAATELPIGLAPSREIRLDLTDTAGNPTTMALVFRDSQGNVHPPAMTRSEPDFHFQPQVYRRDGEKITLPVDTYTVTWSRGPQSVPQSTTFLSAATTSLALQEVRWADLRQDHGLHAGDHHIHAAGCSHFSTPTCGVTPSTMVLHCEGEDVNYGLSLVWQGGGCWDYQLGFFTGVEDPSSTANHHLTTGVELSGFSIPTSINGWGHTMPLGITSLLSTALEDWPHRSVKLFDWAKRESEFVVTAYAHSGAGMEPREASQRFQLPHHGTPRADNIGANGFLAVDVSQVLVLPGEGTGGGSGPAGGIVRRERALDLLGVGENPFPWDLTPWYHALNCGFRTRIAGETDFPCASDQHVGDVRSYVKLGDGDPPTTSFLAELEAGQSYVTGTAEPAGEVHYVQFLVRQTSDRSNLARLWTGPELTLLAPGRVEVIAKVLAYLDPAGPGNTTPLDQPPYWDPERARLPGSRDLDVELVLNGQEVGRQTLRADGTVRRLNFGRYKIERSSWLALRTRSSSHTNPIFVTVANQPIRASQRSADWFLQKAIPAAGGHVLRRMGVWQAPVAELQAAVDSIQANLSTFQEIYDVSQPDWPVGTLPGLTASASPRPAPLVPPVVTEDADVAAARSTLAVLSGPGSPLGPAALTRLTGFLEGDAPDLGEFHAFLEHRCWFHVEINPESRVKVSRGPAARRLTAGEERVGLVRIHNQAGVGSALNVACDTPRVQLELRPHPQFELDLSGFEREYRLVSLSTDETGKRAARVAFDVGSATRDLGLRDRTTLVYQIEAR